MKTSSKVLALFLILVLCLSLAACSGTSNSKDNAADNDKAAADSVTEAPAEVPTQAPTEAAGYGSYKVDGGVLTLKEFTTDSESATGDARTYPNSEGWLVLVFEADGGDINNNAVDSFLTDIVVDDCLLQGNQIGIPDDVNWRYDTNFNIDKSKDILAIYDAPEGYEASLDKIHINAEKAE